MEDKKRKVPRASKTPKGEKTPKPSKASSLARGLSMAKVVDKLQASLKNLVEVGVVEDLSALLKAVADNKDNVVALLERGTSMAEEGERLVTDNRDELDSIISKGEKSLAALASSVEPLLENLVGITDMAVRNRDKISSLLTKADDILEDTEGIKALTKSTLFDDLSTIARTVASNSQRIESIIVKADDLLDDTDGLKALMSAPFIDNLNVITGAVAGESKAIASVIGKADDLLDEPEEMKRLLKNAGRMATALADQMEAVAQDLPTLTDGGKYVLDSLHRLLPKVEAIDEKALNNFMLNKGIRVFLKAFPKL